MSKFPGFPCPGLVFVPKSSAHSAAQLFHDLAHKVETYNKGRRFFEMNHQLLGKGDASETKFALGKIIMNTMGCRVNQDNNNCGPPENVRFTPSDSWLQKPNAKSRTRQKQNADTEDKFVDIEVIDTSFCPKIEGPTVEKPEEISASQLPTQKSSNGKKQTLNTKSSNSKKQNAATEKEISATDQSIEKPEEMCVSTSRTQELMATLEPCLHSQNHNINEKLPSQLESQNPNTKVNVVAEVQADQLTTKEQSVNREHKRKQGLPLSSLFK